MKSNLKKLTSIISKIIGTQHDISDILNEIGNEYSEYLRNDETDDVFKVTFENIAVLNRLMINELEFLKTFNSKVKL
jgi:hypothetical protein